MSRVMSGCLVGFAAVALLGATPALAAPSAEAGLQAMRDFNLIVLGNMTSNGDVEGRALITGNLSGQGDFFQKPHGQSTATLPGLIVGGAINSGENLENGSGAWVGSTINGHVDLHGGGTVLAGGAFGSQNSPGSFHTVANPLAGLPMSLSDYAASLKTLSASFAADATTQLAPAGHDSNNDLDIKAVAGASGLGVIDISDALLHGNQINVDSGGYGVLVINVAGTADSFQFNPGTFSVDAQTTVIWNFYQATSLSITGQFDGSILAPYANLTNNTQINGSVVAAGFNQGGEVHMANFAGMVPEPATWAMMLTGFSGAGALIRRTRRQMRAA